MSQDLKWCLILFLVSLTMLTGFLTFNERLFFVKSRLVFVYDRSSRSSASTSLLCFVYTLWISSNNNLISSIFESIFVWCLRKHIWRSHFFFHKRIFWVRPQSINCLVRVSFALKNGAGGRAGGSKKGRIFWKKAYTYCQSVT